MLEFSSTVLLHSLYHLHYNTEYINMNIQTQVWSPPKTSDLKTEWAFLKLSGSAHRAQGHYAMFQHPPVLYMFCPGHSIQSSSIMYVISCEENSQM